MSKLRGLSLEELTVFLGIDGLKAINHRIDKSLDLDIIECKYTPLKKPVCKKCTAQRDPKEPIKAGFAQARKIYDMKDDSFHMLFVLKQRYICAQCRKDVKYYMTFVHPGAKTSLRLDEMIFEYSSKSSTRKIASLCFDAITPPQAGLIAERYRKEYDLHYRKEYPQNGDE